MLINIYDNRKWGYYNSETKNTIPCRFDDSSDFLNGFAVVCQGNYGVIDEDGKEIIPIKYSRIERLESGLFELHKSFPDMCCLCNSDGNFVDKNLEVLNDHFQKYDLVCNIGEDLFLVNLDEKNGIIYKNQLIIERECHIYIKEVSCGLIIINDGYNSQWLYNFDGDMLLENYGHFHIAPNSLVIFSSYDIGYGIADRKGNIIVKPQYTNIIFLHDNFFKLTYRENQSKKKYEVIYDSANNSFKVESGPNHIQIPAIFDWCGNNNGKYTIMANNFKFGIIDNNNIVVTDSIFKEIKECIGDIAIVKKEEKWQLLHLSNGLLSAEYDDINYLKYNYFIIYSHSSQGVIDKDDNLIVPARYNKIELLDDGSFKVSRNHCKPIYRIIDKNGHIIIQPTQKKITLPKEIVWVYDFSENFAIVENSEGIKGAIDIYGNMAIPFIFRGMLSDFKHGVSIANDGKFGGLVDSKGGKVTEYIYNSITYLGKGYFKVEKNGRYGIIDYSSKIYLPCKYENVNLYDNDCFEAIIKVERLRSNLRKSMIINHDGLIVVQCGNLQIKVPQEYDFVFNFKGDYAKVISNGKWGLINKNGDRILPCEYSFLGEISNNHIHAKLAVQSNEIIVKDYIVCLNGNDIFEIGNTDSALYYDDNCIVVSDNNYNKRAVGIINRKNEIICEKIYDEIGPFKGEYAYIRINSFKSRFGVINKKGEVVIEPYYYSLDELSPTIYRVAIVDGLGCSDEEKYRFVNLQNEIGVLFDNQFVKLSSRYSYVSEFANGLARVGIKNPDYHGDYAIHVDIDNKRSQSKYIWGYVDNLGREVIPCRYLDATDFAYGYAIVSDIKKEKIEKNEFFPIDLEFEEKKYYIINCKGELVMESDYTDMTILSDTFIKVGKSSKYGILNFSNEIIIPYDYEDIKLAGEDFFAVCLSVRRFHTQKLWGVIDHNNKTIIKPRYEKIRTFKEGLAAVYDGITWKFVNKFGEEVITVLKGFNVSDFHNGIAVVSFISEDGITIMHKLLCNGHYLIDGIEVNLDTNHISQVYHFNEGLARAIIDGSWGFIDTTGKVVISGISDNVSDFQGGYAKLLDKDEEDIYINKSGYFVVLNNNVPITFSPDYKSIHHFCQGLYLVRRKIDNYTGIVNEYEKTIIPFTEGEKRLISSANDIQTCIKICDEWYGDGNRFVYYNLYGDRIIPNNGKHIIISQDYGITGADFSSGLVAVSKGGAWGFINENGEEVIPCQFCNVDDFEDDYCIVYNDKDMKSVINKYGTMLFPFRNYESISLDYDGFQVVREQYQAIEGEWESEWVPEKRKMNFEGELIASLHGKEISISKEFDWCMPKFHEGFLSVYRNGKWGVVNSNFNIIIPCLFDKPIEFKNGLAIVKRHNETCIFNTTGKMLFSGNYKEVKRYADKKTYVCLTADRTQFDIYSESGELLFNSNKICSRIIIPETDLFSSKRFSPNNIIPIDSKHFKFEICTIYNKRTLRKWGLSDAKGNIILEAKFDDINGIGCDLVAVCKELQDNRQWGYVNINGELTIGYIYSEARPFTNGIAIVAKNVSTHSLISSKKYGIIGTNSKELTDFVYDSIELTDNGIVVSYYDHKNRLSPDGDRTKLINEKGQIKTYNGDIEIYLPTGIQWCADWQDNYIPVMSHGKWGLLKDDMTFVIKPIYDRVQYILDQKVLCVNSEENITENYIYDIEKAELKQLKYSDCSDFNNRCAIVSKVVNGGKNEPRLFGLIDNNGYELLPCVYGIIQFRETPEEEHYYSHDYYNPYENYTREDSLMDALDGEMDAYWNID